MNENGMPECVASGEDDYGVWLRFANGVKRYVYVKPSEVDPEDYDGLLGNNNGNQDGLEGIF